MSPGRRVKRVADETPPGKPTPSALIIHLTDSIRSIVKSKGHTREARELLASMQQALAELRQTLAENSDLRDDLAVARGQVMANPALQAKVEADISALTAREREVLTSIRLRLQHQASR